MDDYIEYQIITGEDEIDDSSDDNSGGWAILILMIIAAIWLVVKLLNWNVKHFKEKEYYNEFRLTKI